MKRRMIRVFASVLLSGTMVFTMGGMSALAAVESVDLKKIVTTDGDTYAPNTKFEFTVEPVTEDGGKKVIEDPNGTSKEYVVYSGAEGGLVLDSANDFTFSPGMGEVSGEYTVTGKINVNANAFPGPGIYHYTIKENAGQYEGIEYDAAPRDLYVFIVNNGDSLECEGVIASREGKKDENLTFTNNYGRETDEDQESTTHDIEITKVVTGNQGDKKKEFKFTAKIDGSDSGEKYKVVVTKDGAEEVTSLSSGDPAEFSLKHNDSFRIYGLTEGDEYTVTENDYSSDDYVTTLSLDGEETTNTTGKVTRDETKFVVTNDRSVTTPTGLALSFGPYALMVALAGVFATLFLRKKREREEF